MTTGEIRSVLATLALTLVLPGAARGAEAEAASPPTVAAKMAGLKARDGLLRVYPDPGRGKLWLALPPPDAEGTVGEYLYVEGLLTGLGSNPVGLDRGQLGETRVVRFRRVGNRVLVEVPNFTYRAVSDNPDERRAVRESFATSVLWGGEIVALDPDGSSLVDFTTFVVRDAHGVADRLEETGQGSFSLDRDRSAVDLGATLVFPDNLELEAVLTWTGKKPGPHVRETAPAPEAITLVQHHSFIRLPDDGYRPRTLDPRAGSFGVAFRDYAAALDEPIERQWISRHRLERVDPEDPSSPIAEPIVYYVDRGAPEPVRSALVEGASWWEEAFAAAGFPGGFRVELLPEGAHPLDVRYNVIQWVHRSTRGWSYGGGVIDPRTGEIVKGHVSLGSLRVRQDILIFEGLLGTGNTGTGASDDPVQLALARIRQLSAHEVGHTLGLAHNFAASTYGRESVMDYPAPLVRVGDDGELDVSSAYDTGVGTWDVHAIRYAYAPAGSGGDEAARLDALVREGISKGLRFLSDADARPPGAAQPYGSLWDNEADAVAGLEEALAVRRVALERFGEENIAPGRPLALLQEVLAPIYFYHRYQAFAAAKALGGLDYAYALRGDGQPPARPIPAQMQRQAVETLLSAVRPEALDLPEDVLALLLPRPFATGPNRELFQGRTGPTFDPIGAAATAADMVFDHLLQPERLLRVADFHRRDPSLPSVEWVLDRAVDVVFPADPAGSERLAEIRRVTQRVLVDGMIELSSDDETPWPVRSRVDGRLLALQERLAASRGGDVAEAAHRRFLAADVERYLSGREWDPSQVIDPLPPPPGDPIGAALLCDAGSW